jgi:hypothetical protein
MSRSLPKQNWILLIHTLLPAGSARGAQQANNQQRGFPLVTKDEHETTERASFVYDALYASIAESQGRQGE